MKRIFLILILCLVILTGCDSNKTKEVGTTNNFSVIGTNNGFTGVDNTIFYNGASYLLESYKLTQDDIEIEMAIYDNEENAKKAQDNQIDAFLQIKSSGATIKKEKGANYYKYVMISNGYYMVSSKVDNTLIFSKTLLKNMDKVNSVLDEMGY